MKHVTNLFYIAQVVYIVLKIEELVPYTWWQVFVPTLALLAIVNIPTALMYLVAGAIIWIKSGRR